jgi:hypothetical protein
MKLSVLLFFLIISTVAKANVIECGFDGLPTFKFDTTKNHRNEIANAHTTKAEGDGVFVNCGIIWTKGKDLGDPYCQFSADKERNGKLGAIVFSKDSTMVHVVIPRKDGKPILFGCQK